MSKIPFPEGTYTSSRRHQARKISACLSDVELWYEVGRRDSDGESVSSETTLRPRHFRSNAMAATTLPTTKTPRRMPMDATTSLEDAMLEEGLVDDLFDMFPLPPGRIEWGRKGKNDMPPTSKKQLPTIPDRDLTAFRFPPVPTHASTTGLTESAESPTLSKGSEPLSTPEEKPPIGLIMDRGLGGDSKKSKLSKQRSVSHPNTPRPFIMDRDLGGDSNKTAGAYRFLRKRMPGSRSSSGEGSDYFGYRSIDNHEFPRSNTLSTTTTGSRHGEYAIFDREARERQDILYERERQDHLENEIQALLRSPTISEGGPQSKTPVETPGRYDLVMRHPMPPNPLRMVKSDPDMVIKNIATFGVAGHLDQKRRRKVIHGKETVEMTELLKEDPPYPVQVGKPKSLRSKQKRNKNFKDLSLKNNGKGYVDIFEATGLPPPPPLGSNEFKIKPGPEERSYRRDYSDPSSFSPSSEFPRPVILGAAPRPIPSPNDADSEASSKSSGSSKPFGGIKNLMHGFKKPHGENEGEQKRRSSRDYSMAIAMKY